MIIASFPCFIRRALTFTSLLALMATSLSLTARAEDAPTAEAKTESCLQLHRIRTTKVVDDSTVLFYLSSNEVYKNVLPRKCSALRPNEGFLYKSSINQLCSVDTITPLVSAGGGYMTTTSCGLGTFTRIDKETAQALISDAKAARNK